MDDTDLFTLGIKPGETFLMNGTESGRSCPYSSTSQVACSCKAGTVPDATAVAILVPRETSSPPYCEGNCSDNPNSFHKVDGYHPST